MANFSVIIAEDEKLIRNGILNSIDWSSLDAEVSGLAKNGSEALSLIKEQSPDILLTDIKMAGGNGLELIKNAKIHVPDLKVVIISGYNSFEYAQQAIKLGVKDYILKPIDLEKLLMILQKITDEIKTERNDKDDVRKLEDFYRDSRQILVNEFFRELLFGVITEEDIDKQIEAYSFSTGVKSFCPVILYTEIKNPIDWASLKSDLISVIEPVLKRWGLNIESLFLMPNEIIYTDITFVLSLSNQEQEINTILPDIKTAIEQLTEISLLAIGAGETTSSLVDLSFSYQKAKTHALFSMISGLNSKGSSAEASDFTLPVNIYETTRKLNTIFRYNDKNRLEEFLKPVEDELADPDVDLNNKRTILRNLFVCVLAAGDELGSPVREVFPDLMALFRYINLKTIPELFTKIKWACNMIISQQQTRDERSGKDLMEKARTYIHENYSDPLLSLEMVSAHLSLTPAYFSRLYKEVHGVSYIETLSGLRMEKALNFLRYNPEMKISAIAVNVGFNSPSYFNYIFKKTYGKSPREFREAMG